MSDDRKFMNDFARMASGAAGTVFGMKDELEARMRTQMERLLSKMDLVKRDELDAVRLMAEEARAEIAKLEARIAALENPKPKPRSTRTAASKPKP